MHSDDGSGSAESEDSGLVHVIVGGMCFSLAVEDIERHPSCYFEGMSKKEWRADASKPIPIDRDGSLFRYVADYLFYGIIPNGRNPLDVLTMQLIQAEADFYNLPELVAYCEEFAIKQVTDLVQNMPPQTAECEYESNEAGALVNVLSTVWSPFCLKGFADHPRHKLLFKNSTPFDVKVSELLSYGHSSCDKANFNCFEIEGSLLNPDTVDSIKNRIGHFHLCPRRALDLTASKLVLYTEGGYCSEHRCKVHSDGQIGTLLYILNTGFKGGSIIATQNDVSVCITEPREWLAMQTDCVYRVDTVTTGTLVYVEFAVYCTGIAGLHDCWDHEYGEMHVPLPLHNHPISSATSDTILCTLRTYDSVVIALPTLYPILNSDPDCLTDGDRELYTILQNAGYDVSMVVVAIHKIYDNKKILLDESCVVGYNSNTISSTPVSTVSVDDANEEEIAENESKTKTVIPIIATSNWKLISSAVNSTASIVSGIGVANGPTSSKQMKKDVFLATGLHIARL